jgi:hypothetical protein
MRFSQRIGKKPATKNTQLETIDEDLLNELWNTVKILVLEYQNPLNMLVKQSLTISQRFFGMISTNCQLTLSLSITFQTGKFIRDRF